MAVTETAGLQPLKTRIYLMDDLLDAIDGCPTESIKISDEAFAV